MSRKKSDYRNKCEKIEERARHIYNHVGGTLAATVIACVDIEAGCRFTMSLQFSNILQMGCSNFFRLFA